MQPIPDNYKERFWRKVDVRGPEDCWPWKEGVTFKGYGRFRILKKKYRTHRVAFFFTYNRWPKPCCLHRCDNPPCCNPAHLFEGTNMENTHDMVQKGRWKNE